MNAVYENAVLYVDGRLFSERATLSFDSQPVAAEGSHASLDDGARHLVSSVTFTTAVPPEMAKRLFAFVRLDQRQRTRRACAHVARGTATEADRAHLRSVGAGSYWTGETQ